MSIKSSRSVIGGAVEHEVAGTQKYPPPWVYAHARAVSDNLRSSSPSLGSQVNESIGVE